MRSSSGERFSDCGTKSAGSSGNEANLVFHRTKSSGDSSAFYAGITREGSIRFLNRSGLGDWTHVAEDICLLQIRRVSRRIHFNSNVPLYPTRPFFPQCLGGRHKALSFKLCLRLCLADLHDVLEGRNKPVFRIVRDRSLQQDFDTVKYLGGLGLRNSLVNLALG